MSQKKRRQKLVDSLLEDLPKPKSLADATRALSTLVEFHDDPDDPAVHLAWVPAIMLVRLDSRAEKVEHIFCDSAIPRPPAPRSPVKLPPGPKLLIPKGH